MDWPAETRLRIIKDITWQAWQKQQPDTRLTPACMANPTTQLAAQLGADSLQIFQIATAVAVFFELHKTGVETTLLEDPSLESWVSIVGHARKTYDESLRFSTSGSTGQPKFITHQLAHLLKEVQHWTTLLPAPDTILCTVPSHHIYGFIFSVLLPQAWQAKNPNLSVIDFRQALPSAISQHNDGTTLLIGYPDYWRTLVEFDITIPDNIIAISSTAPCPPDLATALSHLGLERLIQIYGSSETAGIAWRETAQGPYQLLPHWHPSPADAPTHLVTADSTTRDEQNAEHLHDQTETETQQNAQQPHSQQPHSQQQHSYPLQDKLVWQTPNTFTIAGRLDHAVQVGGLNVYPGHVANMLKQIEDIENASVRLMRPEEGERLKAFVVTQVPKKEYTALKARIERFCEQHLQPMERPKSIAIGHDLPKSAAGKITDWSVPSAQDYDP